MKKFFIAIVALAAAVACSNDDIISIDRQAIGFGNPFVENSVRADYSVGKSLTDFTVYGTVTGNSNTVALFGGDGATVRGAVGDAAWNCTETEYWVPNCTYAFQAVADGVINNGAITVSVGDGDLDLLYAEAAATTNAQAAPTSGVNENDIVEFNFTHLMSKVGFSFENGSANTAYGFEVTAVSFTGHFASGTYTIGATTPWGSTTPSTTALSFGTGTTTHQIIPGEQTLNVTVAYDILYNDTKISATSVTKPLTYKFAQSTNYNIAVTIPAPGGEIKFTTTTVSEWTNAGSDIPLNFN